MIRKTCQIYKIKVLSRQEISLIHKKKTYEDWKELKQDLNLEKLSMTLIPIKYKNLN